MKKELTIQEIEDIKNNEWVIFTTANNINEPHSIIVIPSKIEKK